MPFIGTATPIPCHNPQRAHTGDTGCSQKLANNAHMQDGQALLDRTVDLEESISTWTIEGQSQALFPT